MAGTATKIVYPSNVTRLSDDSQTSILCKSGQDSPKTWTMTDIDLLSCLQDRNSDKGEVIEKLRTVLRRNGGRLPYGDQVVIFKSLLPILIDHSWESRHICLQLIRECIPKLGSDLKGCIAVTFPRLIPNMGHAKVAIRRDVIHLIHTYMKYAGPLNDLMKALVKHGIEYHDSRIAREVIIGLPLLFTVDFSKENYFEITQSLASRLLNNNNEDNIRQHILLSLEKLRNLIGDETFINDMRKLPIEIQKCYETLTNYMITEKNVKTINLQTNNVHRRRGNNKHKNNNQDVSADNTPNSTPRPDIYNNSTFEFGIVPSAIIRTLRDESNFRLRSNALDELQLIVKGQQELNSSVLQKHLVQFINLLNDLLDDQNFKIITVTLDIIASMIDTETLDLRPFLKQLVYAVTKRMDDSKTVVRQSIMKILVQLMHLLMASQVLNIICENLSHRNGRIRQETLNVIIRSLLTFPSYEFNLSNICQSIAHTLIDPKRQVRQASLETFALLAQAMGAGKLQPLVQAVDSIELCYEGDGVMAAVQARLARRQLPRLNQDRLVVYATSLVPQSAGTTRSTTQAGADIDWIMSASSGGSVSGSARSFRCSEGNFSLNNSTCSSSTSSSAAHHNNNNGMELESLSSARSTPVCGFLMDAGVSSATASSTSTSCSMNYGPSPRRHPSAGKLPWEGNKKSSESVNKTITKALSQNSFPVKEDKHSRRQQSPENGGDTGACINASSAVAAAGKNVSATSYSEIYQKSKAKRQTQQQHPRPQSNVAQSWSMDSGTRGALLTTPRKVAAAHSTSSDLSSTWPDSSMFEQEVSRSHKRFLDPISVTESFNSEFEIDKNASTTPIPTKATLVRATSSKRKVPPIAISDSPIDRNRHDNHHSNRHNDNNNSNRHAHDDDEDRQMANSLRQIRNSATKKKAEKLFEKLEQKHTKDYDSPNSDPDYYYDDDEYEDEDFTGDNDDILDDDRDDPDDIEINDAKAIYDQLTSNRSTNNNAKHKPQLKKSDVPFERKARLARNNSQKFSESEANKKHTEFKPIGGVTFRENRNSDVAIVGRAYGDEKYEAKVQTNTSQSMASTCSSQKIDGIAKRERRRFSKTVLSPLGVASMHHPGSIEMDDSKVYAGVVGKGMFDMGQDGGPNGLMNNGTRRQSRDTCNEPIKSLPQGVYGVAVNQHNGVTAADEYTSSDEDTPSQVVKISRAARERITKNKEIKTSDDSVNSSPQVIVRNNSQRTVNSSKTNASSLSRKKPTLKQQQSSASSVVLPTGTAPQSSKSYEPINVDDLTPHKDPAKALALAMDSINQEFWGTKCDGMNNLRRVVKFHPNLVVSQLHRTVMCILTEIKNLRSQVSRQAIGTLTEMFASLKRNMDPELDQATKLLLNKSMETSAFIRDDVELSLTTMVECTSLQRALQALIASGTEQRSVVVRKNRARFVSKVVYSMGPGRVLSGIKDITDKLLPAVAEYLQDSSLETRYYAQRIIHLLMSHEDFDKLMTKHVPSQSLRNIQDKLDTIRKKGVGEPPSEVSSARSRRSGQGTRSGQGSRSSSSSRQNSACSDNVATVKRRSGVSRGNGVGPPGGGGSGDSSQEIKDTIELLAASDWRDRQRGLQTLETLTSDYPTVVGAQIIKVCDKLIPCLRDSNSKVNVQALQTTTNVIPLIADYTNGAIVSQLVHATAGNLSSKNKDILNSADTFLKTLAQYVDASLLLQPVASQIQTATQRIKILMIERLAMLISQVYTRKPKAVHLHALPVLWSLLNQSQVAPSSASGNGSIRSATCNLTSALYDEMGRLLVEMASTNSNVTKKARDRLSCIIDEL